MPTPQSLHDFYHLLPNASMRTFTLYTCCNKVFGFMLFRDVLAFHTNVSCWILCGFMYGNPRFQRKLSQVAEAYSVLSDQKKRQEYDERRWRSHPKAEDCRNTEKKMRFVMGCGCQVSCCSTRWRFCLFDLERFHAECTPFDQKFVPGVIWRRRRVNHCKRWPFFFALNVVTAKRVSWPS